MPVPICHLRTHRPTPTTVSYTVSTRAPPGTITARILHHVSLAARVVLASCLLLLLWAKWLAIRRPEILLANPFTLAKSDAWLSRFAASIPAVYLVPIALLGLWILSQRGYTAESLLVLRGLGIQTTSPASTYLSTSSTRFIPTTSIQDIFIHEAFKGFEVRFYLAIVVEGEQDVVVVFPKLLPSLTILEEVWRGARECLYESKS